jgi:hypothetical protein
VHFKSDTQAECEKCSDKETKRMTTCDSCKEGQVCEEPRKYGPCDCSSKASCVYPPDFIAKE